MASNHGDIIDTILKAGNPDYSDSILTAQLRDLSTVSPLALTYMIYSSILTLPLTTKMQDANIEAIFVRKVGTNLKAVISYNTVQGRVLKALDIDASLTTESYPFTNMMLKNVFTKISKLRASPPVTPPSFVESLNEVHHLKLSFLYERGSSVVLEASTSIRPLEIDPNFQQSGYLSNGFVQIEPDSYRDSLSYHLSQINSESTSVLEYIGYNLMKILISKFEKLVRPARLSTTLKNMHAFIFGSLKFNWEKSHNLKIEAVRTRDRQVFEEIRIVKKLPDKGWLSASIPLMIKITDSDQISRELRSPSPSTLARGDQRVVVAGIDYSTLLHRLQNREFNSDTLQPLVEDVDLSPYENVVFALLNMNFVEHGDQILARLNYCIRRLNRKNPYGFPSFLLGQLASYKNQAVNKYFFHHADHHRTVTTIVFKFHNSENGAMVDIIEPVVQDPISYTNEQLNKIPPLTQLKMSKVIRMVVNPSLACYMNELQVENYNREQIFGGHWELISDLRPESILQTLNDRSEEFQRLDPTDSLPRYLKSIQNDLFRGKEHVISKEDITSFLTGVFTGYRIFSYDTDFLGIMAEDGFPVFISVTSAKLADHPLVLSSKLAAVAKKYVVDYARDESKRRAIFTSLAYDPDEANGFSLSKFTSFGVYRAAFESCALASTSRARRATISCFQESNAKEVIKFVPLEGDALEYSIEDSKSYYRIMKNRMQPSLNVIGKFSNILMAGQMFKEVVSALIRGDYKSFAVNVAFLASGPLLEAMTIRMVASGSRSLMMAAPFLSRLPTMAFIGYDLYEQIEDYKAGNLDAKINIIGDTSILAIEFTTASIEGAESLGLIAGVSEILGPIGAAIGTAIFIGTDIYSSMKTVEKIDHLVHLTSWQKFTTGFLSFLHLPPTETVREEMRVENIISSATRNAENFFFQHPQVRHYIFPSYGDDGTFTENNNVHLSSSNRIALSVNNETKMICVDSHFPEKYTQNNEKNLQCYNMLVFESTSNGDATVILLGTGTDTAATFVNSPTTFLIGDGLKYVVGGEKSDTFVLTGSDVRGHFDGRSGDNIINLADFAIEQRLIVNLSRLIVHSHGSIRIKNIHNMIGRRDVQDIVQCSCETRYVDLLGGSSSTSRDELKILFNSSCTYSMKIELNGFFYLRNEASVGYFHHIFSKNHNVIIKFSGEPEVKNLFTFHYHIDSLDRIRINFHNSDKTFYSILFETEDSALEIEGVNDNAVYLFEDDAQVRIVNGTITVNIISNSTIESIYARCLKLSTKLSAVVNVFALNHNISLLFGAGDAPISDGYDQRYHINMLPSDPYHATYLVGGGNRNIFRLSMPHLHNSSSLPTEVLEPVKILNYANENESSIVDLYEMVFLIREKFHSKINIRLEQEGADLNLQIKAIFEQQNINLINVTLDRAFENDAYQHILINMRRPMRISIQKPMLIPVDYHLKNESYTLIHSGMIDPYTTIISSKNIYDYETFIYENSTLVLTNLNGIEDSNDLVFIVFRDLLVDTEIQTLRIKFADQSLSFLNNMDEILRESDDFEEVFGNTDKY